MKIALVHDFLKEYGGAERVLETLHEIWPEAPVYTAFVDKEGLGPHYERIKKWKIVESWVAGSWFVKKWHSPLRFLAPKVWENFDFSNYDLVISSSGWYICRGIKTTPPTIHICYLHHPPRHLYGYPTAVEWQKYWPVRVYAMIVNHYLRLYDFKTAQKVNFFIANSLETQRRIEKFYRRESTVIYPPVEISNQKTLADRNLLSHELPIFAKASAGRTTTPSQILSASRLKPDDYFLSVCRLARAKHVDLIIQACQKLNLPLVIVGQGREEEYLKSTVNPSTHPPNRMTSLRTKKQNSEIVFLGEVKDEELKQIYRGAKAFITASEDEEFGISVVEAMGYGKPVIAFKSGGHKETVIDGKTGVLFDELTVDSLTSALKKYNSLNYQALSQASLIQAQKFSKERFKKEIKELVESKIKS